MQSVIATQDQHVNRPGAKEDCTEDSTLEEGERTAWARPRGKGLRRGGESENGYRVCQQTVMFPVLSVHAALLMLFSTSSRGWVTYF